MFKNTWIYVSRTLKLNSYFVRQDTARKRWDLAKILEARSLAIKKSHVLVNEFYNNASYDADSLVGLNCDRWHFAKFYSTYFDNERPLDAKALVKVFRVNARITRFESRKERILSYVMPVVNICLLPIQLPVVFIQDLIDTAVDLPLTVVRKAMDLYELCRGVDYADANQPEDKTIVDNSLATDNQPNNNHTVTVSDNLMFLSEHQPRDQTFEQEWGDSTRQHCGEDDNSNTKSHKPENFDQQCADAAQNLFGYKC